MAQRLANGSIRMADGRVLYANSVVLAADLIEVLPLLTPPPSWPFMGGGGNGQSFINNNIPGATGAAGGNGAQGVQGPQGTNPGVQGPQGNIGTGSQGNQGRIGAQGNQGLSGPQGNQGNQGNVGTGAQGNQGNQGNQGLQGTNPGVQGPQGNQGFQGTGIQGNQGFQGNDGPGNGWTDDGVVVRLTTATDAVSIGTATELAKLAVVGDDPAQTVCILRKTPTGAPDWLRCQESAGGAKVIINFSGEYQSFAAPGDTQPNFQIGGATAILLMGAGGASSPDVNLTRAGAGDVTASNNGAGGLTLRPAVDNTGNLGTNSFRWSLVRAVTVTSGDLNLFDEERGAMWTLREEADFIMAINRKTGKKYRFPLIEIK